MSARQPSQQKSSALQSNSPAAASLTSRPFAPQSTPEPGSPPEPVAYESRPLEFAVLNPDAERAQPLQPRLAIGAPGDAQGQLGDRMADPLIQRMQIPSLAPMPGSAPAFPELTTVDPLPGPVIQRTTPPSKMTPEQIKHANRIRKARGLPPVAASQPAASAASASSSPASVSESSSSESSNDEVNDDSGVEEPVEATVSLPAIPATLTELATNLETCLNGWKVSDDILLSILLGPLRANWFFAKDCLAMDAWPAGIPVKPSHAASITLMQALVDMRGRKWDAFAKKTVPLIKAKVEQVAQTQHDIFRTTQTELAASSGEKLEIGEAVGSQSVTSDIDLSLKGNNTEIGVGLINEAFREEFQVPFDPGTVFDINVYSLDWMHGQTEVTANPQADSVATFNPEPEKRGQLADAQDQTARSDTLEIWSLVKIRRNMTEVQWAQYEKATLDAISDETAKAAMDKKLIEADFEYQTFRVMVETKLEAMDQELRAQEAGLGYHAEHDEHHHEAQSMRASNAIYQDVILQVRDIRLRLDKLRAADPQDVPAIVNLSKQLAYKIAEGLTYANEVYATEGAVLHTVYGKQGAAKKLKRLQDGDAEKNVAARPHVTAVKFKLTPEHYMQSVDENVGDSLHSLNHFSHQPAYAVYRAGKYLERLCEAADFLLTEDNAVTMPHYPELKNIGQKSVESKNGPVGQDPMAVYTDNFFKNFADETALNDLRTKIIAFGAKVSATFHSLPKANPEAQPQSSADEQDAAAVSAPANLSSAAANGVQTIEVQADNILKDNSPPNS